MGRINLILILLLLASPLFRLPASGRAEGGSDEPPRILYVPGVSDPFYYSMEEGARRKAEELGVLLDVSPYPESWDPAVQIPILNQAAASRYYDLIMIAPVANDALTRPLKRLYDQGTQIITVDTKIGDGDYAINSEWSFPLCHIGTDNYAGGVRLAEYLAEMVGERGQIYINTTTPETSTTEERKDGFVEGISHFPEMDLVRIDYNGDLQEVAVKQTLEALINYPDLVAAFGTNVFSSQGVSAAVRNTGLSGAIKVAAWDATEILVEDLKKGNIDLVMAQKPAEIGALAVESARRFLSEGKDLEPLITSGYVILTAKNINDPGMERYFY
jgi:ribose transport system substrate-binding protein